MSLRPIPQIMNDVDTAGVVVKESGEPLISLKEEGNIFLRPAYCNMGLVSASSELLVRAGVGQNLYRAADSLPAGISLVVWDALRSLATQQEIADRFRRQLLESGTAQTELEKIVIRYVSPVPTSPAELTIDPPPHSTGGAVDVCLADTEGNLLDLGTHFDDFRPRAWASFYELAHSPANLTRGRATRRFFRRLLFDVMTKVGFAPYPWEFWHFEYGTKRATAYHGGHTAQYGPMVPFCDGAPVVVPQFGIPVDSCEKRQL